MGDSLKLFTQHECQVRYKKKKFKEKTLTLYAILWELVKS